MQAAACALDLIQAGAIIARGTFGHLLIAEPDREVYEGDRRAWELKQARAELREVFMRARYDPATARRVLEMFTVGSFTVASFYRERHYLTMLGIPEELLPDRWALGRTSASEPRRSRPLRRRFSKDQRRSVAPPLVRQVHAAHQVEGASDPEADLAGTRPVIEELQRPGGRHDSRGGADQHGAPDRDPVRAQDKGPGALGQRDLLPSAGHSMPFGVQGGGVDRVGARGEHRLFQGPVPLGVAGQLVALAPPFAAVQPLRPVPAFQAQARGELRGLLWGLAVAGGCGGNRSCGLPRPGAGRRMPGAV